MQPFPHLNDAPDEISFQLAGWSQIYKCLKVWMEGHTNARTDGTGFKPILFANLEPLAQGS